MVPTVPFPRRPAGAHGPHVTPYGTRYSTRYGTIRHWYENELGWATVPGTPVHLLTGLRFDVLEVPAEAGYAALRHLGPGSPVAVRADRMRLFVAAGSAEELPGLLDWLEWGSVALDLRATGSGGRVEAPLPPGPVRGSRGDVRLTGDAGDADVVDDEGTDAGTEVGEMLRAGTGTGTRVGAGTRSGPWRRARPQGTAPVSTPATASQGAAVWLRPPELGCEVESSLPTLSALDGGGGGAPDLVRLVETMANECHRIRLRHCCAQPLAFS
ncbi:SCO3374 family protein (plasmid) [Streptomyces sp. CWNU-52B]|uniref:SCO3374 family protein n=1 Tax=unclassified Streptomyces TaxID=2593676 RepID=UPI0039C2158E